MGWGLSGAGKRNPSPFAPLIRAKERGADKPRANKRCIKYMPTPPIGVFAQNKLEDDITVTLNSQNQQAPGNATMPLSKFLQRFETPKERALVRTAVHACLRASR